MWIPLVLLLCDNRSSRPSPRFVFQSMPIYKICKDKGHEVSVQRKKPLNCHLQDLLSWMASLRSVVKTHLWKMKTLRRSACFYVSFMFCKLCSVSLLIIVDLYFISNRFTLQVATIWPAKFRTIWIPYVFLLCHSHSNRHILRFLLQMSICKTRKDKGHAILVQRMRQPNRAF